MVLDKASEAMKPVAEALASRIADLAPELTETIAWGYLCFSGRERVFSIVPHTHHVNLQFWRGAELSSAHPALEGTGKGMRHVKLCTVDDVMAPHIDDLIRSAVKLDQAKD